MSHPPLPQQSQKSEWAKFIAGFGFAFSGLWYALRTQRNMRVHTVVTFVVIAAILSIIIGLFVLGPHLLALL